MLAHRALSVCLALAAFALPGAGRVESATGQSGGEPDGVVQVANLVYAGSKSSHCFSDHFLIKAEKETAISTSRRFHAVKLAERQHLRVPLVMMTGEGTSSCPRPSGRACGATSSGAGSCWPRPDARRRVGPRLPPRDGHRLSRHPLQTIDMGHPLFHTVYDITEVPSRHGSLGRWKA